MDCGSTLLEVGPTEQPRRLPVRASGQDGLRQLAGLGRTAGLEQGAGQQSLGAERDRGYQPGLGIPLQGSAKGGRGSLGVVVHGTDHPQEQIPAHFLARLTGQPLRGPGGLDRLPSVKREVGHLKQGFLMFGISAQG